MKPAIKGIIFTAFCIVIAVSLSVVRNTMLDRGMSFIKSGQYQEARSYLGPLSMFGDSTAQQIIGHMYAYGLGEIKDNLKALGYFRQSAYHSKGCSDLAAVSSYYVGKNYLEGSDGAIVDIPSAFKWFRIAAEGGEVNAAIFLGKAYAEGLYGLVPDQRQATYWDNIAKNSKCGTLED